MRPVLCALSCTSLLLALHFFGLPGVVSAQADEQALTGETARERFVRSMLQDARSFLRDGRLESAENAVRRGLATAPDEAPLHALLARVLAKRGLDDEAARHRERADELAPPPSPLPSDPFSKKTPGVVVVLVPPPTDSEWPDRIPRGWPDDDATATLAQRIELRLPSAKIEVANPQSVSDARAWLAQHDPRSVVSLRVERSYCADTVKDGFFAVARLRAASEMPESNDTSREGRREAVVRRAVIHDPRGAEGCEAEALGRVLEQVLALTTVQHALHAPKPARSSPTERWPAPAVRALFPGIGERIEATLTHGRTQLATGRVAAAAATFRRAAIIDSEDPVVRTYIKEADATIAMAGELARVRGDDEPSAGEHGVLDPRFSPAQRAAAEARLAVERQRRADLLVAQEILDAGAAAPTADTLAALRSGTIVAPGTFGSAMASERAPAGIEVRIAVAPDGSEIARYYLARGGANALLREEDADGNGSPDRWVSYANGTRSEIWEDGRGRGTPDLHFVYAPDGRGVARVELDTSGDGQIDRIFEYTGGDLRGESRDTDEDGILDRFVRFDAEGHVALREEDIDGDGQIDTRATYRAGRLLERTFREHTFDPGDT